MIHTELNTIEARLAADGLDVQTVRRVVSEALDEDLGGRGVLGVGVGASAGVDVTSYATVDPDATATGNFVARASGTVAGLSVAAYVMALLASAAGDFRIEVRANDGDQVARGDVLLTVTGNTRALLTAERVALNLLTLVSGVASATHCWVQALAGTGTKVRDSRKTIPGLRMLQKYAVRVAGGVNHRMCLADAALIKDNHVVAAGGVVPAFQAVRAAYPDIPVQVEVTSMDEARAVVAAGAEDVLLDNMPVDMMRMVVSELGNKARFEASGGLTLDTAAAIAATGVDFVAVGAITHSAPILDIALDFVPGR
ncbi:MAG TPA: carboxylating nicotinate-nucleotide diphosphorylase [Propionibacteriaceae bacterium]|nr:carboxylating nicotinate-nucleotide diphosphorylase [Propionibacteriaceae bacterium]